MLLLPFVRLACQSAFGLCCRAVDVLVQSLQRLALALGQGVKVLHLSSAAVLSGSKSVKVVFALREGRLSRQWSSCKRIEIKRTQLAGQPSTNACRLALQAAVALSASLCPSRQSKY